MKRRARAIRIDKNRIRSLAQELEQVLATKVPASEEPLGKQVLVAGNSYQIESVDGSPKTIYIRMQSVPEDNNQIIPHGGFGYTKKDNKPVVVVFVNGSLPANVIRKAAKSGSLAQYQIYPVLIHEITHAADKAKGGWGSQEEAKADKAGYYNDPAEVAAYTQEIVDEVERHFKRWEKLKKVQGSEGKALQFLINFSSTWKEVQPYWTDANKKKAVKSVLQALREYQDQQQPLAKAASKLIHLAAKLASIDVDRSNWEGKLPKYIHLTHKDLGPSVSLTPKLPREPYEDQYGYIIEDMVTPRISFATSIEDAIIAMLDFAESSLYVYGADRLSGGPVGPVSLPKTMTAVTFLKERGLLPKSWNKSKADALNLLGPKYNEAFRGVVPDVDDTREVWATKPTKVKRYGKLEGKGSSWTLKRI